MNQMQISGAYLLQHDPYFKFFYEGKRIFKLTEIGEIHYLGGVQFPNKFNLLIDNPLPRLLVGGGWDLVEWEFDNFDENDKFWMEISVAYMLIFHKSFSFFDHEGNQVLEIKINGDRNCGNYDLYLKNKTAICVNDKYNLRYEIKGLEDGN